jgi:hypothetical protein
MRQRARIRTLVALGLALLIGVPAFATAPPGGPLASTFDHCAAGHHCRTICASKPAGCHAHNNRRAQGRSSRERACAAAGGSWTCRTTAPIACYCGEP